MREIIRSDIKNLNKFLDLFLIENQDIEICPILDYKNFSKEIGGIDVFNTKDTCNLFVYKQFITLKDLHFLRLTIKKSKFKPKNLNVILF